MSEAREVRTEHPVDVLVTELQNLRAEAGAPSYAVIASRIIQCRKANGMTDAAARISRSTVYDAFQSGRRRLNPDLIREIVLSLGVADCDAEEWRRRSARAQVGQPAPAVAMQNEDVDEPEVTPRPSPRVTPSIYALPLTLAACTLLNLFGGWLVMATRLPVYLDMIGTAIASTVLGPWWGVLVAVCTNGGETIYDGRASIPFVVVNMAGALVWGYGVRRFAMGRSLARFFLLNVLVALTCTVIAVPILLGDFSGVTRNAVSDQTLSLAATYHSLIAGVWSSNTLTSLIDKMLCGMGVLVVTSRLPASYLTRMPEGWHAWEQQEGSRQFALPLAIRGAR